jgi:CPA2 family monovalent cation:H+ antiporter-2
MASSDLLVLLSYAAQFRKYDDDSLKIQAQYKNNQSEYISRDRKQIKIQETLLSGELSHKFFFNDYAWDSGLMKEKKA